MSTIPKYFAIQGKAVEVQASYPDTPEGTALANARMEEQPGLGVLAVHADLILLADVKDLGKSLSLPLPKVSYKVCSCCGAATQGRQWPNRDKGFGLCLECVPFTARGYTASEHASIYGYRGIHFDIF